MPEPSTRQLLAQKQAGLLDAVIGEAPLPHFDQARVAIAGDALWRKRARGIAKTWPRLVASLGDGFETELKRYAAKHPNPPLGGPFTDGFGFAQSLKRHANLDAAAAREMAAVGLRMRRTATGLVRRKGPCMKLVRLKPRSYELAVQFWAGREWWIRL